jgi:DNA repair photolyase
MRAARRYDPSNDRSFWDSRTLPPKPAPDEEHRSVLRRGRGATHNPANRFRRDRRIPIDVDPGEDADAPPLATTVTIQVARTIIARNDSPDLPFDRSINPYQGCEHGCVYCYARPTHAYLDLSPGLDFESRLFAKPDAPALLRAELARPGYLCRPMALGTNTDPYQPIERTWRITRGVLEVLAECAHPFTIVTKSALVERDLDLIAPMAARDMARVYVSVTTLDAGLARRLEPRAASPRRRLQAIRTLAAAGVPVGVLVAPVIPQLNDRDLEAILAAAAAAGAREAGYILLRLPLEVEPLFRDWMDTHYPLRTAHVMSLMRQLHGGRAYDPAFGVRQRGTGAFASLLEQRFAIAARRCGLDRTPPPLDTSRFAPPRGESAQRVLF